MGRRLTVALSLLAVGVTIVGIGLWAVRAGPLQAWRIERDLRQAVEQWERVGAPPDRLPQMTDGAPLQDVEFAGAGPRLEVTLGVSPCDKELEVRAVESAHGVGLLALVRQSGGNCTANLVYRTVQVELTRPIGGRQVFNGSSGTLE